MAFVNPFVYALLIGVLVCLAYWPGVSGGFVFDDYQNIALNQAVLLNELSLDGLLRAAFSSGAGPTGRPIAQVSFALNHLLGGPSPLGFKITNILIHALNGIIVFALVNRLAALYQRTATNRTTLFLAFCVATVWSLHPLNLSSVLYVVQRMTSLSATFALLAMVAYVEFRVRWATSSSAAGLAWALVAGLLFLGGIYTKESAVLTPYFILLIEYLVFGFSCQTRWRQAVLRAGFALLIFVPIVFVIGKTIVNPAWLVEWHAGRGYEVVDYFLTQSRILWLYLKWLFVPNILELGLYHDDFAMSRGLLDPVSSLLALIGHVLLLSIAWWARARYRVVTFGILWFYVGHLLESTVLPLMLIFEHRNYLPSLGPIVVAVWLVAQFDLSVRARSMALVLALAVMFSLTALRAQEWGDLLGFSIRQAEKHPQSVRANFDAGRTLGLVVGNHPELAAEYGPRSMAYFERAALASEKLPEPYLAAFQLASHIDVDVPPDFLGQLEKVLRNERPPNNVFYLFSGLRDIYFNPKNKLTVEDGVALFEAARENSRLGGVSRGHMLASYALFMRDHGLDNHKAQALAEEAAVWAPGFIDNRILAAWLSYENGDIERAKRYVKEVEAADRFHVLAEDIRRLRQTLEQPETSNLEGAK